MSKIMWLTNFFKDVVILWAHKQIPVVTWLSKELRIWKKSTRKNLKHNTSFYLGMEKHWGSETMLSSHKPEISTFNKPIELLPLEGIQVCVYTQGEGSCRNCCPSNSTGGNPLPGDAPLHKSTRSITTWWRPARKPDKVLRSLHLPACICNTYFA